MTLEHMLLVGDSSKFLLKKSLTKKNRNGLVISTSQLNNERLSYDPLRWIETRIKRKGK